MKDTLISHDFGYVHTDIPAGMTIREWRAQRAAERGAAGSGPPKPTLASWRDDRARRRLGARAPSATAWTGA